MAIINSNGTAGGNWSNITTWLGGVVPVAGDTVTIVAGDIIVVDGNFVTGDLTQNALTIQNGAELKMSNTVSSTISIQGGVVQHGTLSAGTMSTPLPSNIDTKIIWNKGCTNKLRWRVEVDASLILNGSNKVLRTRATTPLNNGATVIPVADVTGWAIGDYIGVLHTDRLRRGQYVSAQITNITGLTVTIDTPLVGLRDNNTQVILASQRLKVGCETVVNSGDFFMYHDDISTPSTTRFINQIEVLNTSTAAGGHTGFSLFANTPASLQAWKAPIRRISSHAYSGPTYGMTGFGVKNCDHPYNPAIEECVWMGVVTYFARSTFKLTGCVVHYSSLNTTWGNCIALEFNDCWFNGGGLSVLNLGEAPAATFNSCEFSCGYQQRTTSFSPPYFINCNWIGYYSLPGQSPTSMVEIINNTFDYGLITNVEVPYTQMLTLKSRILLADWQRNPKSQYLHAFRGLYKRDITKFRTKIASVKCISRNQLNYPLNIEVPTVTITGSTTNAKVSIYVETDVVTPIEIVLSNGTDTVINTVPLTVGWHDIKVTLPAATVSAPATLQVKLQDGTMWVDDIFIGGIEYDLGTNLFLGGTEISTVVDITDTSAKFNLTGLQPGTEVRIYRTSDMVELSGVENSVTTFGYSYTWTVDFDVIVMIHNVQYLTQRIPITLTSSDTTIPIQQVFDRNYSNPI